MSSCQKALPLMGHVPLWPRPGRRVASTFYGYDAVGRLTRLVQAGVAGGQAVAEKRVEFAYNAASQFAQLTRYADAGRPGCFGNRGSQEASPLLRALRTGRPGGPRSVVAGLCDGADATERVPPGLEHVRPCREETSRPMASCEPTLPRNLRCPAGG
jgi:hypothetical protein